MIIVEHSLQFDRYTVLKLPVGTRILGVRAVAFGIRIQTLEPPVEECRSRRFGIFLTGSDVTVTRWQYVAQCETQQGAAYVFEEKSE